jgi:hypothetical protein
MKKLLFTSLLGLGLLLPTPVSASADNTNSNAATEFFAKKTKKSKAKKSRKSKEARPEAQDLTQSRGCTYNGNQLFEEKEEDVIITPETAKNM